MHRHEDPDDAEWLSDSHTTHCDGKDVIWLFSISEERLSQGPSRNTHHKAQHCWAAAVVTDAADAFGPGVQPPRLQASIEVEVSCHGYYNWLSDPFWFLGEDFMTWEIFWWSITLLYNREQTAGPVSLRPHRADDGSAIFTEPFRPKVFC